jgi:hypothetical protein
MFACASEEEKTSNDFGVRDITPYFTGGNEDSCEMRFEFQANLTDKTYALDFSQNWEIEKISLENYNFYSGTLNNKTVEKNDNKIINNDFIYENKNDDLSRISAIFYKKGYYKVKYFITDYINTQEKELILKIGDVDIPDLYLSLNIPAIERDVSNDYVGHFEISAGNIDATPDYVDIELKELKKPWFNSKIKIDSLKQFAINSGVSFDIKNKKDEVLSNNFIAFSDFIEIQKKGEDFFFTNEEIDITNKQIEISIKNYVYEEERFFYEMKNPLYFSILNFEEKDGKSFFTSLYDTFDISRSPCKFQKMDKNVISSSLFVGTAGVYFKKSDYTVCFSTDGVVSEIVDVDKKRPYPTYPYGYLFGRLGENGCVFPIGKYFLSDSKKITDFYIYNMENNSLEKQE